MPLIVKIAKFEQSHDGYCSDQDEFENKIVIYKKEISFFSEEDFIELNINDGEEISLKQLINKYGKEELFNRLEDCDYGSGYCYCRNVIIDIISIKAEYHYDYYKSNKEIVNTYKSDLNKRIKDIYNNF